MSETLLTGKQTRYLRARAHALKPVVIIGTERCSPSVIAHVDQALEQHELLKVRLTDAQKEEMLAAAQALTEGTGCAVAQRIGHTLVLYRQRREGKPTIHLPR
jgi:RNA-binding protein